MRHGHERDAGGQGYGNFHIHPHSDTLALLGDIGRTADVGLFSFLREQLSQFRRVLYLLGNHEFYQSSYGEAIERVTKFASDIATERVTNSSLGEFVLLDRNRIDLSPSLTILGATLWSQLDPTSAAIEAVSKGIGDFRNIVGFTPERFAELHQSDLAWLNAEVEEIRAHEPYRGVIVFTHHAPALEGTSNPRFAGSAIGSAFATDLTGQACWGTPVELWAFGHTHWCSDSIQKGVRVVSNQRGYSQGTERFDTAFIIEL